MNTHSDVATYAYDIECFPNFFSATFVNVEDEADRHVFFLTDGSADSSALLGFLKTKMTLVGYNCHSYDDPMLRFIMSYRKGNLVADLYKISSRLISDDSRDDKIVIQLRYPRDFYTAWHSIDLMKLLGFDKLGISLKQVAINLKWYWIKDLPIPPYERVHSKQEEQVLEYNLNDVLITKRLYEEVAPLRELRNSLSEFYGIDFSSASKSKMANLILEKFYVEETRAGLKEIKKMRTEREKVFLGNCLASWVSFSTPQLQEMLNRISSTYVYSHNKFKYSETVNFAGLTFSIGVGGLHTGDTPGMFVSDDKHKIRDVDGASYYPNLIIANEWYPEHLGMEFISVLKRITKERMEAKKNGDKVKAESLKITINSIFGKMGDPNYWLYDPLRLLSTTVTGQMGLIMLVERFYLNGIQVLSCNTDGVVCRIPIELEEKYYEVAHEWENITGISLEFTDYKKYVRRDVNSYITQKTNSEVKEKGAFLTEIDLAKAYHMPIVARALREYFLNGIDPECTIRGSQDIMDFCISQKSGDDFSIELHGLTKETQQKTNRFFISTIGGSLVKRNKNTLKLTGLYVGKLAKILNLYDPTVPFSEYKVDYAFYKAEAYKIIDKIEPKQQALFDLGMLDPGRINKIQMNKKKDGNTDGDITPAALNRLGKNQLPIRLNTISATGLKVPGVSPRYVYVRRLDQKDGIAEVYCLAKGVYKTVPVDKRAMKKLGVPYAGSLLYCTKFDKSPSGFVLVDYRLCEKFKEDAPELDFTIDKPRKV